MLRFLNDFIVLQISSSSKSPQYRKKKIEKKKKVSERSSRVDGLRADNLGYALWDKTRSI